MVNDTHTRRRRLHQALFLGQYFKNTNDSGTKLILNSNVQALMAAKICGSAVIKNEFSC